MYAKNHEKIHPLGNFNVLHVYYKVKNMKNLKLQG